MGLPVVADDGGVRRITFDRPEVANALTVDDLDAVAAAVSGAPASTRAIVLTGTGERAFSAGMHVESFRGLVPATARELITHVAQMLGAVRRAPVPTIAVVNGACVGAAFELTLVCDIRIACEGAKVGLPEVLLGIPSVVDAALLPAFVGPARSREMILTGGLYDVADLGPAYANRIVAREALEDETMSMLAALTAPTPEVVAAQKELFEIWRNSGLDTSVARSIDVFADVFAHQATTEAIERYRRR